MANKKSKEFNFEQALSQLQEIVNVMENGQLPLEDSLTQFEQGIRLAKECQLALQTAEQKVKILLNKEGEEALASFEELTHED